MVDAQILRISIFALPQLLQHLLQLVHFLAPDALIDLVSKGIYSLLKFRVLLRLALCLLDDFLAFDLAILVNETLVNERL